MQFDYWRLHMKIFTRWARLDLESGHPAKTKSCEESDELAFSWFASQMNMSVKRVKKIFNHQAYFTLYEVNKACEVLDIPLEFIPVFFFTEMKQPTNDRIAAVQGNVISVNFG